MSVCGLPARLAATRKGNVAQQRGNADMYPQSPGTFPALSDLRLRRSPAWQYYADRQSLPLVSSFTLSSLAGSRPDQEGSLTQPASVGAIKDAHRIAFRQIKLKGSRRHPVNRWWRNACYAAILGQLMAKGGPSLVRSCTSGLPAAVRVAAAQQSASIKPCISAG